MIFARLALGAPLAWAEHRVAGLHNQPLCSSAAKMSCDNEEMAQSYAAIFAEGPGISRAWALPRDDSETLMVQRTSRDIEGTGHGSGNLVELLVRFSMQCFVVVVLDVYHLGGWDAFERWCFGLLADTSYTSTERGTQLSYVEVR